MAQLDAGIILGAKPIQVENPMSQLAKMMQVQGIQQQNQLGQMKMDQYKSETTRQNKLAALLQGQYGTPEERESALLQGGFMDESQKLTKGRNEATTAAAQAEKLKLQTAMEKLSAVGQIMAGVKDQASYDQARAQAQAMGLDVSQSPPQYDPAMVEQKRQQALTMEQQLAQVWKQKGFDLDVQKFGEVQRNNQAQNAISRGQLGVSQGNLALSRQRLAFDQGTATAEAGGPNQAALSKQYGKAPPGYRWKDDGTAEAIPGGPADIKSGEAGAKAQGRKDAAALAAGNVLSAVSDAKKLVGMNTTGPGSMLSKVPGTDARDLQAKLDTVKANLGFDRLQQMREMSPTGGALGAVAVQELIALQSTVASLDQAQSAKELKKSLDKIEGHYNKWLETVNGGAAPTVNNPTPASPQDQQAMEWANANPNDPRAKQILQRLGGR